MRSLLPATFDVMRDFARAQSVAEVHTTLLRYSRPYGATHILAAIIPNRIIKPDEQQNYLVLGHWPDEWIGRYFERQYVRRDPTILHSMTRVQPLWWTDIYLPAGHPSQVMMDEAKEFLLVEGLTIPQLTVDGHRIALSFSGDRIDKSKKTETILTVLASYAVARALEIRSNADVVPVRLTERERECLAWISEGKSADEIAGILGIVQRVVERRLQNAREKLSALTTAQAVATAIRLGLL